MKAPLSAQELEFLHAQKLAEVTIREKYERFKLQCLRSNIPFSTFRAFETKQNYKDFQISKYMLQETLLNGIYNQKLCDLK